MNNKLSATCLVLMIVPVLFGCGGPVKEENKSPAPAGSLSLHEGDEKYFAIDTKESVVMWKGAGPMGDHEGYVYLSKGELMMENGQLAGGAVEVDMNTIEDESHGSDNNLIKHLKDPDFFDVNRFRFSTIVLTGVASISDEEKEVTGSLTIKDSTQPVTFPVRVEMKDGMVKASSRLVIDRTKWGIRYNSGKFFDNLKDRAISDSIELNIQIVAKKISG